MKAKRILSLSISLLLVLVLLFSVAFVIAEAEHDCSGEDCPVCRFLSIVENTLKKLSFAIAVAAAFLLAQAPAAGLSSERGELLSKQDPVSLKVKLSN